MSVLFRIKTSFNSLKCNMAGYCTRGLHFNSPATHEYMTCPLMQYPAILHSKPLNNMYLLIVFSKFSPLITVS